jgi:hypothetical protein
MNKKVKSLWLRRLRSGRYKQGFGYLCLTDPDPKRPDAFCCLGVLCDIAVEKGVIDPPEITFDKDGEPETVYYDGDNTLLPPSVTEWAGVADACPRIYLDDADIKKYRTGHRPDLAQLNDDGLSFEQIADIIEKYL